MSTRRLERQHGRRRKIASFHIKSKFADCHQPADALLRVAAATYFGATVDGIGRQPPVYPHFIPGGWGLGLPTSRLAATQRKSLDLRSELFYRVAAISGGERGGRVTSPSRFALLRNGCRRPANYRSEPHSPKRSPPKFAVTFLGLVNQATGELLWVAAKRRQKCW